MALCENPSRLVHEMLIPATMSTTLKITEIEHSAQLSSQVCLNW